MDWVKIARPKQDAFLESDIPFISCGTTHIWVQEAHIDQIAEVIGKRPRRAKYEHGLFEGVQMHPGSPVMAVVHVAKEILDIFGLKHVYVKHQDEQIGSDIDRTDSRNLFLFTDCVPGLTHTPQDCVTVVKINGIDITVPDIIQGSFKKTTRKSDCHEIKDDNGTIVAYAKDNKVWITFNIGGIEGGREKNWHPSVLIHAILCRALPLSYSVTDILIRSEEERIAELEKSSNEWIKAWVKDSTYRLKNLQEEYEGVNINLRDAMMQIAALTKRQESISRQIDFEETGENGADVAKAEFAQILRDIPELEAIEFKKDQVIFRTSMISIEEDMAKNPKDFSPFELGEFEIICAPGHVPTLVNMTRTLKYNGGEWHAPHAQTGNACFGNISARVAELSGQRKWRDVVKLTVEYLKNVTTDDTWGSKSFKHWKKAAAQTQENVSHKEEMLPAVKIWSQVTPVIRQYNLKPSDKVCATCPGTCGLKDKKKDDGSSLCVIQDTGVHNGIVTTMLDRLVHVGWTFKNDKEEEIEANCMGFGYEDIQRVDGQPLFDGDDNLYVSEERKKILSCLLDAVSAAQIRIEAEDFQYLPDPIVQANCESPELTLNELERTQKALTALFED